MKVHLSYGSDGLDVELPDHADVIEPVETPALADARAALREAIARPIQSRPLAELVGPDDHVAIVFSDITRPVPNAMIAPELLRVIEGAGVPRDQITLIIGGGLHRAMTPEEQETLLGAEIVRSYRVVMHDARDPDGVVFLERYPGERRGGIYLNAHYMRANVRVVTGFVEPHLFAGYSGGGKGVFPGVAAAHNIMRNHGVANIAHPHSTYAVAEGNPIFEEMRRVAVASDVTMLCNVTLNAAKAVTGVFCGELVAAHDAAIAKVNSQALRRIPHEYDIVVGSNGGYPADLNLYQSVKGMVSAARAVRRGGAIMLAAECREGVGGAEFAELLTSREGPGALMERLLEPDCDLIDQWQVQEQVMVQEKADLHLYSALDEATVRTSHLRLCIDISATVASLAAAHEEERGERTSILAMPYGFQAIPVVDGGLGK